MEIKFQNNFCPGRDLSPNLPIDSPTIRLNCNPNILKKYSCTEKLLDWKNKLSRTVGNQKSKSLQKSLKSRSHAVDRLCSTGCKSIIFSPSSGKKTFHP